MANPQVEDGHIKIAHDLFVALYKADLSALERRIVDVIMNLTYAAGRTKGEISTTDIRYQLEGNKPLRTDRIDEAINSLVSKRLLFRQMLVDDGQILGIQKDFDEWLDKAQNSPAPDKMSHTLQGINKYIYINNPNKGPDKMSETPPQALVRYAQQKAHHKLGVTHYRIELKAAKRLYQDSVTLTHNPHSSLLAIKDFLDETYSDEWRRDHIRMVFTYALNRFERWWRSIPAKDREAKLQEEVTGYRFRYNHKFKRWEKTDERLAT